MFTAKPSHRLTASLTYGVAVLALVVMPTLTGCDANDPEAPSTFMGAIASMSMFVEDADGETPTDPAALLFETVQHNPIMAPDGRQVTFAEFSAATGTASVECIDAGTRVTVALSGLIPNGVYTLWNVVFDAPGFEPTFEHMSGLGTLGPADGSQNGFVASATGTARVSATTPPGALSMVGEIEGCVLTDEFEWHLVGAYHLDHRTYGPDLGPEGTVAEQFAMVFVRP